jgi:hypothetical protein
MTLRTVLKISSATLLLACGAVAAHADQAMDACAQDSQGRLICGADEAWRAHHVDRERRSQRSSDRRGDMRRERR